MSDHALLSPSSAHRWLHCTPSPRLEATLPENTSEYAVAGTLAHNVCEVTAKKKFGKVKPATYTRTIKKLKTDPLWDDEMLQTADLYVEHLSERAMGFSSEPYVAFEVQVDISDFVPESFGRCDSIMFGETTLIITDYKHGVGVPVNVVENPQMMLYALGAYKLYKPLFGEALQNIELWVDQPRIKAYNNWGCTVQELLDWGEKIRPTAQMAFMGFGEYHSGSWCKFCRANGICAAQAKQHISAFDDFSPVMNQPSAILTPEQMSQVLERGKTLVEWYNSTKEKALAMILSGTPVPGYKAVEGRTSRVWSDQDKALETLEQSGIDRAVIYDTVPKSLAQLNKMLGDTKFNELVGAFVVKRSGSPSLAADSSAKPAFQSAAMDFAEVATHGKEVQSKSGNVKGEESHV